ncbi:sensor histidine kinase [Terricaulis silvestris]|nr:ATP-binding protein [Terricaulis silvestris]
MSHTPRMDLSRFMPARLTPERRVWAILLACGIAATLLAGWAVGEAVRRDLESDLARKAETAAALHAAVLRSELEKHQSLPVVLVDDPDVAHLLVAPSHALVAQLNDKLEGLAAGTRAAVIYVLDADGLTRAASNWRLPTSFVGANYSFRPYFQNAMRTGAAEFFALGTVSGRPGLYLARRVDSAGGRPLGVVVVKVEFDTLEAEWREGDERAYVVDPGGVVLVTSVPDWRFRTTAPLNEARRRLTLTDQTLGAEALQPLPFAPPQRNAPQLVTVAVEGPAQQWMHTQTGTAAPGWTLHLLTPAGAAIDNGVAAARVMAVLIVTIIAGIAGILLRRHQQAANRARAEEDARLELERRIDERTHELRDSNLALNRQIEERERAEAARELLRDELVQSSKLATLGQIAAGVAHEINQPVAAIQTHAETAHAYLERRQPEDAKASIARIESLTQRIGAITQELRQFARKSEASLGPVGLNDAIDGALLLLQGRLRDGSVSVEREVSRDMIVVADRFRLEQVIVNLVQNAHDAVQDADAPLIRLTAFRAEDRITLLVRDNGPGVSPSIRERLFTPFTTTRPAGLGLGLVICRDIVASFGGELDLLPSENGATFAVVLNVP